MIDRHRHHPSNRRSWRRWVASFLCALLLAALISSAAAAEVTRDSYREAVEPICKTDTQANERIFKGIRAKVRKGELTAAAVKFEKAAKALNSAVGQLRVVPRPPADEARLDKWLDTVSVEVSLLKRAATKLRHGSKSGAQQMVVRLTHQATIANSIVIPFQFHYCRLEPSRFT